MSTNLMPLSEADLGTILIVGAGTGAGLAACLATRAETIVLVEPDEDARAALLALAVGQPRVTVLPYAVTPDAEAQPAPRLRRFNFAELNSLRAPTGVLRLFPGLDLVSENRVRLITPQALLAEVPLSETRPNWLVIEAPGEEAALLMALHAANLLQRFDTLLIQGATEPLFEGAMPVADLLKWLESVHFTNGRTWDLADPERPHVRISRNHAIAGLENEIAALKERLAASEASLTRTASDLEALRATHYEQIARASRDLDAASVAAAAHEAEKAALLASIDTQKAENAAALAAALAAERDESAAALAALTASTATRLAALQAESDARTAELAAERLSAAQTRERLEAELRTGAADRAALQAHEAALGATISDLRATVARLTSELEANHELVAREREAMTQQNADQLAAGLALARVELEAQLAAQAHDHDATLLAPLRDDLKKRTEELAAAKAELLAATARAQSALALRTELETRCKAYEARESTTRATSEAVKSELEVAKGRISGLTAEVEKKSREALTARQDLSMVLRSQALTQSDLRDLQARYKDINDLKARQEDLLRKLTQRLGEAAQVLQTIATPPAAPALALPGSVGKSGRKAAAKAAAQSSATADPGKSRRKSGAPGTRSGA